MGEREGLQPRRPLWGTDLGTMGQNLWWPPHTFCSSAPMMAGPWHCTRLSWFTGWFWMKFFTNSRKAATLFLSSLLSARHRAEPHR